MSSGEDAGEMLGPILAGLLWSTGGVVVLMAGRIVLAVGAEAYTVVLGRRLGDEHFDEPPDEPAAEHDRAPPPTGGEPRRSIAAADRRHTADVYRSAANAARVRAAQAEALLLLEETGRLLDKLDDALELVEEAGRLRTDMGLIRDDPWPAPDPAQPTKR